jgi:hypothetical protein
MCLRSDTRVGSVALRGVLRVPLPHAPMPAYTAITKRELLLCDNSTCEYARHMP